MPYFSILMPSFNYAWCLRESIDSVLRQTWSDWELIVVDDGSSDTSLEILHEYQEMHSDCIRVYQHPDKKNHGLVATYRYALKQAKGDYIAFLECDDLWKEEYLEQKKAIFENYPSVGAVYNDVEVFGESKEVVQCKQRYIKKCMKSVTQNSPFKVPHLWSVNYIPTFSCMSVRRQYLTMLNWNIPTAYTAWLDCWLWNQLAFLTSFYCVSDRLTKWRIHGESYNTVFAHSGTPWKKKKQSFLTHVFWMLHKKIWNVPTSYSQKCAFYASAVPIFFTPKRTCKKLWSLVCTMLKRSQDCKRP